MAAAMISADDKVEPADLETAESVGQRISPRFDLAAFRPVVGSHSSLPDLRQNARLLGNVLDDHGKAVVVRYLYAIASADGEIHRKGADAPLQPGRGALWRARVVLGPRAAGAGGLIPRPALDGGPVGNDLEIGLSLKTLSTRLGNASDTGRERQ
jgi:hypothetical protein